MDPLGKINTGGGIGNICSSDSFNILPPPHHDLMSANSIELNAAASLSDDSGVPNSSISSGDSYKLGMCKFENEMAESDGEVSQFDSLDNFSEGGMSAENFNTLKKGPLGCPIDPPPEFQDSPQTTLVRSISKSIVGNLRRWTSSQSSFEHLRVQESASKAAAVAATKENHRLEGDDCDGGEPLYPTDTLTLKESYAINKHLYSSDSILNTHTDNIYDEPNNIISSSLGNSVDILESESSSSPLPPPPPPVSIVKIKQTLCPYFQDHTRYFKAIPSEQDNITNAAAVAAAAHKFNQSGLSEIHDYDLYYGAKRGGAGYDSLQRKVLYSPLNHSHHCHSYHYHTGSTSCGNRPNSRNSLNSRLSSSHNSLSVSSANKPDDSIFITQAMSHDALLTREISDFYNVPIDSDIYAFPVDMIQSDNECHSKSKGKAAAKSAAGSTLAPQTKGYRSTKSRNKRKRRQDYASGEDESGDQHAASHANTSRSKYRLPVSSNEANNDSLQSDDQLTQEPLHMTLDEVKQFYHSLYAGRGAKGQNGQKSSNETIWSVASSRNSRTNLGGGGGTSTTGTSTTTGGAATNTTTTTTTKEKNATNLKKMTKSSTKLNAADNESAINNNNNNNNINTISNHNKQQHHQHQAQQQQQPAHNQSPSLANAEANGQQQAAGQQGDKQSTQCTHATLGGGGGGKQHASLHGDKKSQFTVSLKQKFCSFFRFRRHNRCRSNSTDTDEAMGGRGERCGSVQSVVDDKRKKFQSRALPPLPKKNLEQPEEAPANEEEDDASKKAEHRPFHFTSSIEKVKDYGWYWGPLSSEAAEKVLSNEPDGSFIVRDSSDDHYIFSLSFKLNNCVRHVRIEQDQGTFSFGSYAKFKSQTITEFIEKAVEHSRSGRYLFFLHRRPEHGPMRVQLTNPVSRFKHVQSLQHMCRFVILKAVIRKDLIQTLPLPRRLLDYLNYKHCYSEQIEIQSSSNSQMSGDGSI